MWIYITNNDIWWFDYFYDWFGVLFGFSMEIQKSFRFFKNNSSHRQTKSFLFSLHVHEFIKVRLILNGTVTHRQSNRSMNSAVLPCGFKEINYKTFWNWLNITFVGFYHLSTQIIHWKSIWKVTFMFQLFSMNIIGFVEFFFSFIRFYWSFLDSCFIDFKYF